MTKATTRRLTAATAALAMTVTAGTALAGGVQINEIRIDQPGSDDNELLELLGPPGGSLDGLTYIVIGDGGGGSGQIEEVIDLTGMQLDRNGFFFITGDANLNFENSDNVTHVLVDGFSGANGDDLDADDDGTLDTFPWSMVVDAVSLIEDDSAMPAQTEFAYAKQLGGENVGPEGPFVPGHIYRCVPAGVWFIGPFDPTMGVDSPGMANPGCPGVTLTVDKSGPTVATAGEIINYTLEISNNGIDPANDVMIVDTLPAGVTFVGQSSDPMITLVDSSEPTIGWDAGTINGGESVTITLMVQLPDQLGDLTNMVDITTSSAGDDPRDNSDSAMTSVIQGPDATVVINELDPNTVGTDMEEFIEIYDGGRGNTSLDGLVVVLWNGFNDQSYLAIDLTGQSTDGMGYFVIGNTMTQNVDLVIPDNTLQNGADAVSIHEADASLFPDGTPVTAGGLVDAVVYGDADPDDKGLLGVLGGTQQNEGALGDSTTASIGRLPNGTGDFTTLGVPTPGMSNEQPTGVALTIDKSAPSSGVAGAEITYTLEITNNGVSPAENVMVMDTLPDDVQFVSEMSVDATLIDDVGPEIIWDAGTINAGVTITITVTVLVDGDASGTIVNMASVTTTSKSDDPRDNMDEASTMLVGAPPMLIINEFQAAPDGVKGDANGDGTANTSQDEFVEIVNAGGGAVDISGWVLADAVADRHVFPAGSVIASGCNIVVFGGGRPTGDFGMAEVQVASSGFLGLTNNGDMIMLFDDGDLEVDTVVYGTEANAGQSLTLDPDISGAMFVLHSEAEGSAGALFSPGTMIDGSAFAGCTGVVTCAEDLDGNGIVGGTDLLILLNAWGSSGPGDLDASGTVSGTDLLILLNAWGPCVP